MQENDLDLLIEAAQSAGQIARRFFGNAPQSWDKPEDAGPVTEADLAVNDMLEAKLRSARPGYGWLSEESADDPARQSAERIFIVDPIDGTRSFIKGETTWAHALAVAEAGRVIAGVVYLPMKEALYSAQEARGAYLNGAPIKARHRAQISQADVLVTRPNLDPKFWTQGKPPELRRHHRPSLAYRMALVAEGRFDAMLTLRPSWEWDIAAGSVIASEAGARVTDRTGAALRFNAASAQQNGVVLASEAMHAGLLEKLSSADWP